MFWIIAICILSYLTICLIAYLTQEFFLFHPEILKKNFRFEFDIPFQEINLDGAQNSEINGLWFPVKESEKVIFYFKGNTRSIKGWSKFAHDFIGKGYSFFLIDYPGFGKSTGKRSEQLIYDNAQLAYEWLCTKYNEEQIVIYGRSLGAGFAAYIAARNHPFMLILDSPFYQFLQLARYYTRILPTKLLMKYQIPLDEYVKTVKCPTFILHGDKDWMIPYRYSKEIEKIAPLRIRLFTIAGARHNNLPKFSTYHEALNQILHDQDLYKKYTEKC